MTVPVPAGNHPVSAIVTAPGRAIVAAQVSLASGRANMGNVTGTLPVANGGTGATNAEDARENLGVEPVVPMTTDQVDDVMDDDESIVSDNVVNGTVFSYIWGKIKTWASAAFAPNSHTHTQSNISDLPIDVANGGTGATTASGARTNLEITPSNIGAAPTTHNHSGDALTPASVAATGAVSGSSVSDSVGSLASLRESVSRKANGLSDAVTGDLNDLDEPGMYARNSDTVSNTPSGSEWAGAVLVMSYGTDHYRVFQLDMSCGDNSSAPLLFVRHSYHSGGSRAWSTWSRLL